MLLPIFVEDEPYKVRLNIFYQMSLQHLGSCIV